MKTPACEGNLLVVERRPQDLTRETADCLKHDARRGIGLEIPGIKGHAQLQRIVPPSIKTGELARLMIRKKARRKHDGAIDVFPRVVADINMGKLETNLRAQQPAEVIALNRHHRASLSFTVIIVKLPRLSPDILLQRPGILVEILVALRRTRKSQRPKSCFPYAKIILKLIAFENGCAADSPRGIPR